MILSLSNQHSALNIMKRILTALVALPILLATVWVETPYYFAAITAIAALIALYEFYKLASKVGCPPGALPGYVAALVVVAAFVRDKPVWIVAALAFLAIISFAAALARPEDMSRSLASVSATVFGVIYTALLAGYLVGVRMTPDTETTTKVAAKLLTMFFAIVMMTDTGAYYTGRTLGRHKLAPRVSPGKTIEGSIGGFIAAALAGLILQADLFSIDARLARARARRGDRHSRPCGRPGRVYAQARGGGERLRQYLSRSRRHARPRQFHPFLRADNLLLLATLSFLFVVRGMN